GVRQDIDRPPCLAFGIHHHSFHLDLNCCRCEKAHYTGHAETFCQQFRQKKFHQTLNRKCRISPSWTRYSLPSRRMRPASRAPASPRYLMKSSKAMVSARMKPFSKSVWITAAACGAVAPALTVQARTSFTPAVK